MLGAMSQAQVVLGWMGQVTAIVVLATPLCTTIKDTWTAQSVGDRSPFPFLAALFNSAVWILCGNIDHNKFLMWLGVGGAFVQAIYFTFFMVYSTAPQRRRWIGWCFALVIAYCIILWFFFTGRTSFFSYLCATTGILVAVAPLFNIRTVYQSGSMECMPPWPVPFVSLVNSAVWTRYAFAGNEVLGSIAAPNITALITTAVQLLHHICFYIFQWPELGDLGACLLEEGI